MSGSNLETRSLIDELRSFDSGGFFDLGHPLLNRMAESFVRAAGIGAIQAVAREAYFTAVESGGGDASGSIPPETGKHHRFPNLRGAGGNSVEALVISTGKESVQWGLAAGAYSGLTYGLKEARGVHDWKNSALAGAITGAALAMTCEYHSHEQVVQYAITGAAISAAANILTGIF
ncbi:hypothetical protein SASPL_147199 [Salvia splendens]|uniref:Mitochondrial import inner membrane translocase subunit TIM22 n=1 Tax=Salvia splendens TaxID=180675 RepID=A0A8X8WD75_SALSN|nr:outer envelope pore protein 16-2, chloroplastic [Salvia splendens]KAG6392970.1 hypothetical protein SASPL_147199 [Salvia splendens]